MKIDFLASENHILSFSDAVFFHFHYRLKKWKKSVSTSQQISYIS